MTFPVAVNDGFAQITATAGQTLLTADFPILSESEFNLIRSRDGVDVLLVLGDDYTVAGVQVAGGFSVTLAEGAEDGDVYTLVRETIAARVDDRFSTSGAYTGEGINAALDRLMMLVQELRTRSNRSFRLADSDPPGTEAQMPAFAGNQGKVLSVNEAGDGLSFEDPLVNQAEAARDAAQGYRDEAEELRDQAGQFAANAGASMWDRPVLGYRKSPPPSGVSVGDRYLIHVIAQTGDWVGHAGEIAQWDGADWEFSGAPKVGQACWTVGGAQLLYGPGVEEENAASQNFWRPSKYANGLAEVGEAARLFVFGDSIMIAPDAAASDNENSVPARFARAMGLNLTNDAVSGTGLWSAAWHAFARSTLDPRKGNNIALVATGHNTALAGSSLAKIQQKAFHETFAMLAHFFGDFTPADDGGLSTVGSWTADVADGLGLKSKADQSGAGQVMFATAPAAQINDYTFTGEAFILHTFRGDGLVSGNRNSDVRVFINGNERTAYVDDGLWEVNNDGVHMGHAVYFDGRHGYGTHTVTVQSGANCSVSRPCYIDGFTALRSPSQCNTLFLSLPLRPTDLTPTTALSGGTATDANFDAVEAGIRQALSYFHGYPVQVIDPNLWLQNSAAFADSEHPNGLGTLQFARGLIAASKTVPFNVPCSTYQPVADAGDLVNVAVTPSLATFSVQGDWCTVMGHVDVDPVLGAPTDSSFTLTLPVPSDLQQSYDLGGAAIAQAGVQQSIAIGAKTDSNKAWFLWAATDTTSRTYRYHYSYRIRA